jgi:hypothetical protein
MAYDTARGRLVLFGGYDNSYLGDTWEFDGAAWHEVSTSGPSARRGSSMAYHEPTGQMVLFGGQNSSGELGDTWTYDGATWTAHSPNPEPVPRYGAAMWYDPSTLTVRLYAGELHRDIWEFDGTSWTLLLSSGIQAATYSGIGYDANLDMPILFGGRFSHAWISDQTYEVTDSGFVTLPSTFVPEARHCLAMCYVHSLRGTVLFGGISPDGYLGDTWIYRYHSPLPDERCVPTVDLDGDGLAGCADPDCDLRHCPEGRCVNGACRAYEELCGNQADDDGDGLTDCADPDCDGRPCRTGLCANLGCP